MATARARQIAQRGFDELVAREHEALRHLRSERTDWNFLLWRGANQHLDVTRALLGDLLDDQLEPVALATAC